MVNNSVKLDINNLLLRGSVLLYPESVIGVTLYAGNDTKIKLRQRLNADKTTPVRIKLKFLLFITFIIYTCLALFAALYHIIFISVNKKNMPYIDYIKLNLFTLFLLRVAQWFQLLAPLIPTGLYTLLNLVCVY